MNRNQQSSGRPGTIFSAGAPNDQGQPNLPGEHKPKSDNAPHHHGNSSVPSDNKWFRWGGSLAVIIVAVLIAAALALFMSFRPPAESDLVNTDKLQAVFLTNDQVYFGKITDINSKYLTLTNIYYLQTASSGSKTASNNISLVKLGCELHKPQDRMVISQQQVSFWENLQSDGQVAKAVASYQSTHSGAQKCDTGTPTTNPVQGAASTQNNNATTNNSTTNSANKNQ